MRLSFRSCPRNLKRSACARAHLLIYAISCTKSRPVFLSFLWSAAARSSLRDFRFVPRDPLTFTGRTLATGKDSSAPMMCECMGGTRPRNLYRCIHAALKHVPLAKAHRACKEQFYARKVLRGYSEKKESRGGKEKSGGNFMLNRGLENERPCGRVWPNETPPVRPQWRCGRENGPRCQRETWSGSREPRGPWIP